MPGNPVADIDPLPVSADSDSEDEDPTAKAADPAERDLEQCVYDYRPPGCKGVSDGWVRLGSSIITAVVVVVVVWSLAAANDDGLQPDLQPGQLYHGDPGIGGCDDPAVCCNCH